MNTDFHIHTAHSCDSEAPMEDVCLSAINAGLTAIAITDHIETAAFTAGGFDRTLEESVKETAIMAKRHEGTLRIAIGMELGEAVHDLETAEEIVKRHKFDFILGSLHNLKNEQDFFYYDYATLTDDTLRGILKRYFAELLELVRWGKFNSLAHLNYPMRYIPKERGFSDMSMWAEETDEILKTAIQKGLALEINTSGLRHPAAETLPPPCVVRRFRELGGEHITIGSDAHNAADVGRGIAEGAEIAKNAGFTHSTVFFDGKAEMLPL